MALKTISAKLLFTALFTAAAYSVSAQAPHAHPAGLERNGEYMSVLGESRRLECSADSIANVIASLRGRLAEGGEENGSLAMDIMNLEGELIAVRSRHKKLAERINAIEYEWIAVNMTDDMPHNAGSDDGADRYRNTDTAVGAQERHADLVRNAFFVRSLSANDYAMLMQARSNELTAARLAADYDRNYRILARLKAACDTVSSEIAADSLSMRFRERQKICTQLSDSLASVWDAAFDNKTYIYELLFDREGREDLLSAAEESQLAMRQNLFRERGRYASDAIVNYCFGKRCLLDYETAAAAAAGLQEAVDSLEASRSAVENMRYDYRRLRIKPRDFIVYEPMIFAPQNFYDSKNPIPQCPVNACGTIYRICLEHTEARQPTGRYRGLRPVFYRREGDGTWTYYAGGYRSAEEAESALNTAKRIGFAAAVIAAWFDGEYAEGAHNVARAADRRFLVEIEGADDLSPAVREIISDSGDALGITRTIKGIFVVGSFRSASAARQLAEEITAVDASLRAVVTTVSDTK